MPRVRKGRRRVELPPNGSHAVEMFGCSGEDRAWRQWPPHHPTLSRSGICGCRVLGHILAPRLWCRESWQSFGGEDTLTQPDRGCT